LRLHDEGQKWNGRSERATLAKYEAVTALIASSQA
jgi:hypothetical protein